MGELGFQKKMIDTFIKILDNSLSEWDRRGFLPPGESDKLSEAYNLLIKQLDSKIIKSKLKELMTFIGYNAENRLLKEIENRIKSLKTQIIKEKNSL